MRTDTIYNLNYWLKRGFNEQDAKNKVELSKKETSWRCKEFWIKRGYSEIDAIKEISKKQHEISLKRDRNKKNKNPYSYEYYIEKGISDENEIKKLIQDLKNKSNPYLICSKEKINEIIKKRNETYYSKTNEEREKINISRGLNKQEIINKFGIEKSEFIFKNRGKGKKREYEKKYSKVSISLFDILKELNKEKNFLYGNDEKFLLLKSNIDKKYKKNGYYVDFLYEKNKKIIEFNGDFWHFNPKKYLSESFTILKNNKIFAKDVWEQDRIKIEKLKENGYEVLVIWESDLKKNKDEVIRICNEFINK
jgi:hypothetical protein